MAVQILSRRAFSVSALALAFASGARAANTGVTSIWPVWADTLRADLERMAKDLTASLKPWSGPGLVVTVDQKAGEPATKAIQAAIDSVAQKGGGTVRLAQGDYVSGTLDLRSHVRLEIAKGARLLASLDLHDFPDRVAKRPTVMDSNMGMNQSLIFAEGCVNIALAGEGTIDGRGASFKGEETIHGTPGRPFLIRVIDCKGVHISGLRMLDSPCWMQNYLNCDDLLIESLNVENQANFNNDGLDIDGCRRVIVRNCIISSGDDSLCFKGAAQRPTENVLIEHCTFLSSCNALKLGTDSQSVFRNVLARHLTVGGVSAEMRHVKPVGADSGISWEVVDGGLAENILATDIRIIRARSPLFMRVDDRGRVRPGEPKPPVGTLRRVVFERITGEDNGPRGSYFIGIPAKRIADVALRDVNLSSLPTTKPVLDEAAIPEMYNVYPDAHMLDTLGDAPAYGLWMRHVENITLVRFKVTTTGTDPRPMLKASTDAVNVQSS